MIFRWVRGFEGRVDLKHVVRAETTGSALSEFKRWSLESLGDAGEVEKAPGKGGLGSSPGSDSQCVDPLRASVQLLM